MTDAALATRLTYRPDELATMLGVSRATIWRRLKTGELPSIKRFGVRLVPASAVEAILGKTQ